MNHIVTSLVGGKPAKHGLGCPCYDCVVAFGSKLPASHFHHEPHIYKPCFDPGRRPFEDYQDQPDTAARMRLAVQSIPFALPEKRR